MATKLEDLPYVTDIVEDTTNSVYRLEKKLESGVQISYLLIKFKKSWFIYISTSNIHILNNLAVSLPNKQAISSLVLGQPIEDEFTLNLASRLSLKFQKQIWISCQLPSQEGSLELGNINLEVERYLKEWLVTIK